MKERHIIAAVCDGRGIGYNNKLIWRIPADMQHFKELTLGNVVIMGRKTYESIGKPLNCRDNIVVTSKDLNIEGVHCVRSLEDAYRLAEDLDGEKVFVFDKERFLYFLHYGIMFIQEKVPQKHIMRYPQFFATRKIIERLESGGKGGIIWHTQGSGKSYSMVMFARKVRRKVEGNFTFLVITDRDDLDTQIYKNFVRTEVVGNKEECQPKNGQQLREYLQTNKSFIFTLIHKFRYDKTKKYLDQLVQYCQSHYSDFNFKAEILSPDNYAKDFDEYVKAQNIDLMLIPNKKRNIFSRLFSPSVAHRMVFHSDVPLLVVPIS